MRTLILVAALAAAQLSAFDAVSIRENTTGQAGGSMGSPPGRFRAINQRLGDLIAYAHGLDRQSHRGLLVGGPAELLARRFDVVATLPPGTRSVTEAEEQRMLRAVLEDRFGLRTHTEPRTVPVYALRTAQAGRLGPTLRPIDVDCGTWRRERAEPPRDAGGNLVCGTGTSTMAAGLAALSVRGVRGDMAWLIELIQPLVDRPIADESGLAGSFEWDLTHRLSPFPDRSDAPDVFVAVREQLGLALEPTESMVDALVIDEVSLPEPN